ncbi:MAG: CBO0543 family protein [Bacillus sp. (in: firmicutes)]
MRHKFEKNILRLLFVFGIGTFFNLIRKPPLKDWLIIFLMKSYIATILDNLLVKKGYLKYPVNLFKTFDISVLFSYLIFPISCIYYNQITKNSSIIGIIIKCLLFSIPAAFAEGWLEKNTKLIKYKKSWTMLHSLASIASTFLIVRGLIVIIRRTAEKQNN